MCALNVRPMTTATASRIDRSFLRARMGSLLAVVPLGVWTVDHLWRNLAAFRGASAWQDEVTSHSHPLAFFLSSLLALVPLALHTVWGIGRLASARPNNVRYGTFANLKYAVQRLSAIGILLFLGAHLWLATLHPRFVEGHPEPFDDIANQMRHHGPTLTVYLLGTLGVAYHLANGLHSFAMGWGLVVSRRALRKLDGVAVAIFLALLAMSWSAIYALWAAGA